MWLVKLEPHSRDLRKGRESQKAKIYLVTTRCRSGKPFADGRMAKIVVDEIATSDRVGHSRTLAYVVMPDHLHWLFQLSGEEALSRVVGLTKGRAARRLNAARERRTPAWQSGFHDHAVRRDEDLERIAYYLVANPVRAGLVDDYREYPWLGCIWDLEGNLG